ncbi:TetR/AcrR family transcriptional regulator [Candidatus Margulisiibacteriota bacterium]
MGRRNIHSSKQLEELILATTEKIVEKDGFQKLSARGIASTIGYSVGTLYNAFENLDEIISIVNLRTLDRLHEKLKESLKKSSGTIDSIVDLARCYIDFWIINDQLANMLFNYSVPRNQDYPRWKQEKIDDLFKNVTNALIPILKNNKLAGTAASVLWAGLHGICNLTLSGRMTYVSPESAYYLAESFVKGYLTGMIS